MADPEPGPGPELVGLRKAIRDALLKHPKVHTTAAGAKCAGRNCDWVKPGEGNKSTTQRFANHQTFEVQQAVTAWLAGRSEGGERVSRETLPVLRRD